MSVRLDLRASLRGLRRNIWPQLFAGVALALGFATVAAVMCFVDAVFLARTRHVADPHLFIPAWISQRGSPVWLSLSPLEVQELRSYGEFVRQIGAFVPGEAFQDTPVEAASESLVGTGVDAGFFEALGVQPIIGRLIGIGDSALDPSPAAVIAYRLWTSRFGGDPDVLDSVVTLAGRRFTIVGVMPRDFDFPASNVWTPLRGIAGSDRFRYLQSIIRLQPGVNREAAEAALRFSGTPGSAGRTVLSPAARAVMPPQSGTLLVFLGLAGLALLAAWLQLVALQLGRVLDRAGELAARLALGASLFQSGRVGFFETAIVAVASSAAGYVAVEPLVSVFAATLPADVAGGVQPMTSRLYSRVLLGVSLGILMGAGAIAVGLVSKRLAVVKGGNIAPRPPKMAIASITAVQLGVTGALLYVGVLLAGSFVRLAAQPLNFDVPGLYVVVPQIQDNLRAHRQAFTDLARDLLTIEGITHAAESDADPLGSGGLVQSISANSRSASVRWRIVGDRYLDTVRATLVWGRWYDRREDAGTDVAVINEGLAARLFDGNTHAVMTLHDGLRRHRVVGIVRDMRNGTVLEPAPLEVYTPAATSIFSPTRIVFRTNTSSNVPVVAAVRQMVAARFPQAGAPLVRRMADTLRMQQAPIRVRSQLVIWMTSTTAVLALLGVFAAVTHMTSYRRREFAVRASLGAGPGQIQWGVIRWVLVVATCGLAGGILGGLLLGTAVRHYLFGVGPMSPWAMVTVMLSLWMGATAAAWVPSRRASLSDPSVVLRAE